MWQGHDRQTLMGVPMFLLAFEKEKTGAVSWPVCGARATCLGPAGSRTTAFSEGSAQPTFADGHWTQKPRIFRHTDSYCRSTAKQEWESVFSAYWSGFQSFWASRRRRFPHQTHNVQDFRAEDENNALAVLDVDSSPQCLCGNSSYF